ncbi:MAG: penicillin-binding transpeptidase domain-containing protein [Traorella sp.]
MKINKTNIKILVLFLSMIVIGGIISFSVVLTTISGIHLRSGTNVLEAKAGFQQSITRIVAKRGLIKDRDGEVIAQNRETYTIVAVLSKDRLGNYAYVEDKEFTAKALAPILNMSEEDIMNYLNLQDEGIYQTYLGEKGKNLTIEQKKAIEAIVYTPDPKKETTGLPGIEFEKTVTRVYTPSTFSSTLLGFATYDASAKRIVGQVGIEAYLDEQLSGVDGKAIAKKDAFGYSIPGSQIVETATNGNDVYLTLDKDVQDALEDCLKKTVSEIGAENAWAIVMEVETGKILGYGGYPTYDLNKRDEVLYVDMPSMFTFEPGSVMKPFTYAISMEEGVYDGDATVETGRFCIGYNDDYTEIYRKSGTCSENGNINDANRKGWGEITLDEGLIRSSNTCIATLLTKYLDDDVFWEYLDKLGFFKQTGVEGLSMSEESGIKNNTYAIERLTFGFGQGSSVTALQLVQAYTAIFNDGYEIQPYYVDKIVDASNNVVYEGKTTYVHTDEEGNPVRVFSSSTCKQVMNLMKSVIQDKEKGTGSGYNIEGFDMIAKTGTGEIAVSGKYGSSLYTSSIMAAAPSDDPKIMVYYAFQSPYVGTFDKSYFKSLFTAAYEAAGIKQTSISDEKTEYDNWQEYEMPALINHTMSYVENKMDDLDVHKIYIGDGDVVVDQYPSAHDTISTNQNVFIKTNSSLITLPNMINWTYKDVMIYQQMSGLNITCVGSGVVVKQSVTAKTSVTSDTLIVVELE